MTPNHNDDLGKRLRAMLYIGLALTLAACAVTALIVVSLVSQDRIDSEAHLRCQGFVQARAETRRNDATAIRRALAHGVPEDDTAILVLRETRDAAVPKRCVKVDGEWRAVETHHP